MACNLRIIVADRKIATTLNFFADKSSKDYISVVLNSFEYIVICHFISDRN